ncbi:MAG: hypothetical protein ABFD00_06960 [Chloroherpetonaceae bacterium]
MKKTIIAIWGNANSGKSTTIKLIYTKLIEIYQQIKVLHKGPSNTFDITKIIQIEDIKVGIESQGDPNSNLFNSLRLFSKEKCQIIVCATRTKGNTVNEVMKYENQYAYEVIWLSNLFSGEKDSNILNGKTADFVTTIITDIIKGDL